MLIALNAVQCYCNTKNVKTNGKQIACFSKPKKNLLSANGLHTQKKRFSIFPLRRKNVTGTENARKY